MLVTSPSLWPFVAAAAGKEHNPSGRSLGGGGGGGVLPTGDPVRLTVSLFVLLAEVMLCPNLLIHQGCKRRCSVSMVPCSLISWNTSVKRCSAESRKGRMNAHLSPFPTRVLDKESISFHALKVTKSCFSHKGFMKSSAHCKHDSY